MVKELSFVAHYGIELRYVALFGLAWFFMELCSYVVLWNYTAFSRGHRSKFIWSCLVALKVSNAIDFISLMHTVIGHSRLKEIIILYLHGIFFPSFGWYVSKCDSFR